MDSLPFNQQLFAEFSFGQRRPAPFDCVHHAFEHHALLQPSAVAVEHLGDTISYFELDRSANHLAGRLRVLGVVPGSRVCILAQRSIPLVVGILAVLKAGGAYVPLDGGIVTSSTLNHVLHDSQSTVVLALDEYRLRLQDCSVPVISLDDVVLQGGGEIVMKPDDMSNPKDGVYIIYTSGTTGKPKGVDVMHYNVTNLVCLAPGNLGMKPGRRVSQLLNIAFDMAAWEILGSLCNGCTLCIRGKSSKEWRAVMKTVDVVIATPSMMIPHQPADYPNIKVVATAGEVCPQALADAWAEQATFINSCGPTEITIVNTTHAHVKGTSLSIGRPTPNNNVYVLDDNMAPLPIGEVGVMWAGGAGITRGYVNLPEKTAERYMLDPFTNDGSMMFNTGDLGRWRADGTLEHLGRVDDQVKVKGFRVELDGVAAAMETCSQVAVAVALLIDSELWGFVTPAGVDIHEVIASTSKIQPYYAVPARFLALTSFPHTANGKTDKRALRELARKELEVEKTVSLDDIENIPTIALHLHIKGNQSGADLESSSSSIQSPPSIPPSVYDGRCLRGNVSISTLPSTDLTIASSNSSTVGSKVSPSALEKGNAWDGYENDTLPDKTQGKFLRNLRHQVFSLYRRLFGVVFVTNMAIFIWTVVRGSTQTQHLGLIVVSNLFCAILMRQDYVINTFFNMFCAVPTSWPLSIRRVCARVYHIGGLHSGCAISGVVWLILFTVQATREVVNGGPASIPTVAITYCILALLLGIVTLAHPKVRSLYHNHFEVAHRFLGWSATALVWCQVILLTNDYRRPDQTLGQALIRSAPFWLVLVMSMSIILPWIRLRKVPVRAVVLSNHAVRLYFDYVTPITGSFTRISDSPLMEWHGFATVPEPGKKGYSLVVSRAGDWTSKQIANPPKELWVRGIPTFGVLRIVPLFRRVVFVATGSGIGPCAPCILEQRVPIRLLWTSPNVRQTFGDELVDAILEKSPGAVVYDTRAHGKPDMVKLTYRLVREFNAEAVCVISNQKLTRKIVYGMMSRGIPAFGAIWDS
ncbi:nonribosomal peptide synthetase 12 [Artomyces pyxidatus]|uniref:Nonribosomal peptide synthetase 12 n=1 Tax=Artomyces pyxidatus TaxID=48021 RepID=A0ACB8SPY0_9AGAM|nr:nonribosomal peptide synthetase 12 [Artomyces pyxidatus]